MKSWEEERPIYEEELTPQQKELAKKAAKEHLQKEYERGRKTIVIMMGTYVGMKILATLLSVFVIADAGQGMGYFTIGLLEVGIAFFIAYNLYHGKQWARMLFGFLLAFSIINLLGNIMSLDIGRTDYTRAPGNTTLIYSEGKVVEVRDLGEKEISEMQEQEDARAMAHRIVAGMYLIFLAVEIAYFYLLFAYHPVKEFLYGQETNF
jgi:uncharacterized membrane protein